MNAATDDALPRFVIRLADDALVLGQRLAEWTSNGPSLEEDIAIANISLDFLGRARMLYAYAGELLDKHEDELAFLRSEREYTNLLINELPRGDYAFTTLRQFFVDSFDVLYLDALTHSSDVRLAAIAAKAVKEARYHLRRSRDLTIRLGDGTAESRQRMQSALEEIWGYRQEMFIMDPLETQMAEQGIAPDRAVLEALWQDQVDDVLKLATLDLPDAEWQVEGGRAGVHTEHLGHLLAEMQSLHRAHPGAQW